MPDQSAHLTDFRLGGHQLSANLSFYIGRLVVEALINQVPSFFEATVLFINITTGDYLNIEPGFRVDLYTAGGLFKGRTRVRYGNTITASTLPIREKADANLKPVVGDIVRIYRDVRLSDKLVEAIETFPPDGTPYSDQGSNPPPLPSSGGAWAGSSALLPILMTGSESALVDPDSVSTPTHLYDPDGLTISSGVDTDADIELTGAEGEYLVGHTVTDPNNGKSITQLVPVVIDDHPYKALVESLPNDEQRGGSARVRMLENVLLENVPDGALGILWKEEYIGGVRQSFGARAPGRSHVLYVGILRREEGEFDGSDGTETLTFELISPLARLEELMGYGKVMLTDAAPDAWNKMKELTVRRGLIQLPMFYSTLIESGYDLIFASTYVDYDYSGFFLDQSNPLAQMRELTDGIDCRLIEDRRGRFEVQMKPDRTALADRASLPVTLILSQRDVTKWRYTRDHWKPVDRLELRGFTAGATNGLNSSIFSVYPGDAPGEGNQQAIQEKRIAASQAALNAMAGRTGAALDGVYIDANGVQQAALDLELELRGSYDVFDFYDELIELDWSTVRRGLDLSAAQYYLVSSSIDFHDGTATTTIRLRTCTHAPAGVSYFPPTDSLLPPIETPPPPPITQPPSPIPGYTGILPISGIAISAVDNVVERIDSFSAPSTFNTTSLSSGSTGVGIWGRSDPFNYKRFFKLSDLGLQKIEDVSTASGFVDIATDLTIFGSATYKGYKFLMSHLRPGWIMALSGINGAGVSFDYGASWTQVSWGYGGTPTYSTSAVRGGGDVEICGHNKDHLYAIVERVSNNFHKDVYKSTNGGLTWTLVTADAFTVNGGSGYVSLHIPYKKAGGAPNLDNGALVMYVMSVSGSVIHSNDGGLTWVGDLSAGTITDSWTPSVSPTGNPWVAFTHDATFWWVGVAGGASGWGATLVSNNFADPTTLGGSPIGFQGASTALAEMRINGWSMNPRAAVAFCPGGSIGVVALTTDGGVSWIEGTISSFTNNRCAYAEFSLYPFQ